MPTPSFTEAISPYLPLLGVIIGGLIVGGFAVYNRRRGNVETKLPSIAEVWAENRLQGQELNTEREYRRFFEILTHRLGEALVSIASRFTLNGREQKALDEYTEHLKSKEDNKP